MFDNFSWSIHNNITIPIEEEIDIIEGYFDGNNTLKTVYILGSIVGMIVLLFSLILTIFNEFKYVSLWQIWQIIDNKYVEIKDGETGEENRNKLVLVKGKI